MDAFIARKMREYENVEQREAPTTESIFDDEASKIFTYVDQGKGDSVLSIMPWLGAIREPKRHLPINPEKPNITFAINFVFGYKTEDAR